MKRIKAMWKSIARNCSLVTVVLTWFGMFLCGALALAEPVFTGGAAFCAAGFVFSVIGILTTNE